MDSKKWAGGIDRSSLLVQADWEIDDLASDMRKERQLILKQARELQKQQEYLQKKQKELMAIERRIAEKEAIWRKKTKKIERNKSVRKQSVYNGDDGEDVANYRHTKSKTGSFLLDSHDCIRDVTKLMCSLFE